MNVFDAPQEPVNMPDYAPAGDLDYYRWAGVSYPRVTSILDLVSSGQLFAWGAKRAALRAAAPLVHAGLYEPDLRSEFDQELFAYIDAQPVRHYDDPNEALKEACDWKANMKEPFRNRDTRGHVGTIMHLACHQKALGTAPNLTIKYVRSLADQVKLSEDLIERFSILGKDEDEVRSDLADNAKPYIEAAWDFIERYKPEFVAIGLESCVIHKAHGWAGTADWWAIFQKSIWTDHQAWDFPGNSAQLIGDWKSSKHLSQLVGYQLGTYASAENICLFSDRSEHPVPESEGLVAVHVQPGKIVKPKVWAGREVIDSFYEGFLGLQVFAQSLAGKPRAKRFRQQAVETPKKGERSCPFDLAAAGGN